MKKCVVCGAELEDEMMFCGACGSKQDEPNAFEEDERTVSSFDSQPVQPQAQPVYQQPIQPQPRPVQPQPQPMYQQPVYQESYDYDNYSQGKKGTTVFKWIAAVCSLIITVGCFVPLFSHNGSTDNAIIISEGRLVPDFWLIAFIALFSTIILATTNKKATVLITSIMNVADVALIYFVTEQGKLIFDLVQDGVVTYFVGSYMIFAGAVLMLIFAINHCAFYKDKQ